MAVVVVVTVVNGGDVVDSDGCGGCGDRRGGAMIRFTMHAQMMFMAVVFEAIEMVEVMALLGADDGDARNGYFAL